MKNMFGVKLEKLKLNNKYTTEEFFEKIAGQRFEAGVPQLVKYGPAYVIAFPEQDRNNQVQIQADRKGVIYVQRATTPIGLDKAINNMIMDNLTGGLSSMSILGGKAKKRCIELVDITVKEIESLGL